MKDFTLLAVRESRVLIGDTAGNFYVIQQPSDAMLVPLREPIYWHQIVIPLPVPGYAKKMGALPFRRKVISGWPDPIICAFDCVDRRWFVYKEKV